MSHEDTVSMFGTVGFVASNQGDTVSGAKPGVEVRDNCGKESTTGIRVDGVICAERLIVLEEHCGNGEGSIVFDGIGLRKFRIVLNDK